MRQRIYIAGPISLGVLADNIKQGTDAAIALMRAGFSVFTPQLSAYMAGSTPQVLPHGTTHEDWMDTDLPWVAVADAVLRLPGESVGADKEVALADSMGIPVYTSVESLIACPPLVDSNKPALHGVGTNTATVTNERGAKQSGIPYRCDLLPPQAVLSVANVLHDGAKKYGEDNWRGIPVKDHVNHAIMHYLAYLAGDKSDDHLSHAACRGLMAAERCCK